MRLELIVIVALVIYISIMHFHWHKKNLLFKEAIIRLIGLENLLSEEGLETLISKILKAQTESKPRNDKIFDKSIQELIFKNQDHELSFLHYTKEEQIANDIMQKGFLFETSFHKTAEQVRDDKEDFAYKHYLNRPFGPFVVLIGIDKELYSHYHNLASQGMSELTVEQSLSKNIGETDDGFEDAYLLPGTFVKGYFNSISGEIHLNPSFDSGVNILQSSLKA